MATNVKESITRPRDQVYIDPNPGANRDYHEMLLIETSGMHNIYEIRIYLKYEQITNKKNPILLNNLTFNILYKVLHYYVSIVSYYM